ncbi:MAG: glycosyltransferase family 2 protein [Hydrococcus sp. SU_1_0]|nr:glycosyltransferase family 2 protein [Hydrococcus sp. SU_1_0]
MKISVIVPTYRRPQDLKRCLKSLNNQTRTADEILVIVRDIDTETWEFLENYEIESLPLHTVTVTIPGQVAALNIGLEEATGDIIAITDDDGAPRPQWLSRIEAHFLSDNRLGGVGGRDWMYVNNKLIEGDRKIIGKVQWFGRTIGNHHFGKGKPREVEILKGANMSYRRFAIGNKRFDERLLGTGAQVHNDLEFSLSIKKSGWKIIYDPFVEIDHYYGKRFDEDRRSQFDEIAWFNEVHNITLVLLEYLPSMRKIIFLIWTILIGTRKGFGFAQWLRFLPQEGRLVELSANKVTISQV